MPREVPVNLLETSLFTHLTGDTLTFAEVLCRQGHGEQAVVSIAGGSVGWPSPLRGNRAVSTRIRNVQPSNRTCWDESLRHMLERVNCHMWKLQHCLIAASWKQLSVAHSGPAAIVWRLSGTMP